MRYLILALAFLVACDPCGTEPTPASAADGGADPGCYLYRAAHREWCDCRGGTDQCYGCDCECITLWPARDPGPGHVEAWARWRLVACR